MRTVPHYISGKTVEGQSGRFGDIYNPSTGEVQAQVQLATQDELSEAVASPWQPSKVGAQRTLKGAHG